MKYLIISLMVVGCSDNACDLEFNFLDSDSKPSVEFMHLTEENPVGIIHYEREVNLRGIRAEIKGKEHKSNFITPPKKEISVLEDLDGKPWKYKHETGYRVRSSDSGRLCSLQNNEVGSLMVYIEDGDCEKFFDEYALGKIKFQR